ncbi:3'-5' exonuclease [Nocardia sp. NPDC051030]|uniref:3'-5' exonuclease n=1 Tax=Nocardia sp. NPDC051030 TaxID=3155162 RepID=UPI003442B32F
MANGGIEIRNDADLDAALPELTAAAEQTPARLFANFKDSDLLRLGIDERTLLAARVMTDSEQLDAARNHLPTTQWDVLFGLAAGLSLEQVWSEIGADLVSGPIDASDLDTAVRRSPGRVLLVEGPEELLKVFADPFALWRIYLHPTQQTIVDAKYRGPARVTGGPGTGKTVVALHRARRLAERGAGRVLLTTFTSTLAGTLEDGITTLIDDPHLSDIITVRNVDRFAHNVFREKHGQPRLLDADTEVELWRLAHAQHPTEFTETFLAEEWRHVLLAQALTSVEEYRTADRKGRGRGLGRLQKTRVWEVASAFEALLVERGAWTWETLRREATRILQSGDDKPFRHIIVDEAQDLGPDQWRLLRAAVAVGHDDLFIAGDTHQRIYDNRVSLRDTGIDISGRSRRLSINYRTTAEILGWSLAILRGEAIDDMDGGLETIAGCRSEMHGTPPDTIGFETSEAELKHIATTVQNWLDKGVAAEEIGIASRANWVAERISRHLAAARIPVRLLTRRTRADQEVSVGTMHRMKGLEFRCMIVAGAGDDHVPATAALTPIEEDPHAHERDLQRERCLLFVACTRAREKLLITWHGRASRFLRAVQDV